MRAAAAPPPKDLSLLPTDLKIGGAIQSDFQADARAGWDWDLLLPYVLFMVRESPQASTVFTPFELLFCRWPRGLLDVAKMAMEDWAGLQPQEVSSGAH